MRFARTLPALLGLAGLVASLAGCDKVQAQLCPTPAKSDAKPGASAAPEAKTEPSESPPAPTPSEHDDGDRYMLPFAWESSDAEPLGKTRNFLAEALGANSSYAKSQAKLFPSLVAAQTPRATIVACSDSAVQSSAFDATPENDDYVIRNWGNHVDTDLRSLEYGVEHLNTPLLLIVGHTGCSAMHEAKGGGSKKTDAKDEAKADEAKADEAKADDKKPSDEADEAKDGESDRAEKRHPLSPDAEAVVANVHAQVTTALAHFGKRVQAGRLTVVGVVLDVDDSFKTGAGRLVIVDVNANRDEKRLAAFVSAVMSRTSGHAVVDEHSDERSQFRHALLDGLASIGPGGAQGAHD